MSPIQDCIKELTFPVIVAHRESAKAKAKTYNLTSYWSSESSNISLVFTDDVSEMEMETNLIIYNLENGGGEGLKVQGLTG